LTRGAGARRATGAIQFVVAGIILMLVAYVLSWRILWDGVTGSDSPYHLDLTNWIASSFPAIDWWYRWDAGGVPYHEGYPLAVHWLTVAVSRATHLGLTNAMELVQFSITPLCAIGVYAFCALRLKRPLVGLVAGGLYLLSPMAWTFLVDWGFFANQAGTVLFMPFLIALDLFFEQWTSGARGWRYRLSAIAVMALTAALGMISPAIVGAPLIAIFAYGAAVTHGSGARRLRWIFLMAPLLVAGAVLLAAFWALPLNDYLHVVAARQPPQVYGPDLFHLWTLGQVLQLHPIRPAIIQDRTSLSPAVWIPALVGTVMALWDGRIRVFLALIVFGLLTMTAQWWYAATFDLPLFGYLATFRAGMLFLQFLTPILAGLGLLVVPRATAAFLPSRVGLPSAGDRRVAAGLIAGGLLLGALGIRAFALHVDGYPHRVAYGAFEPDVRDLWKHHSDDPCAVVGAQAPPLCGSARLSNAFSITELINGCRDRFGNLRPQVPLCAALKDIHAPQWSANDDQLVASTLSWCATSTDPVCRASFSPLAAQLLSPAQWRPPTTGCRLDPQGCATHAAEEQRYATIFPAPPQRAVVDAHVATLLQSFHDLAGGGQGYGYNTQLLPSPELDSWMMDNFLTHDGTTVKDQLAQLTGADAVVLGATQTGRAADYEALGWTKVSTDPLVYAPPSPSGLATEWSSASTVLVVGATPDTASHPYNDIFEQATQGMIPFSSGWLVRGRSAYVDDYSSTELSHYRALLLLGYRYHDAQRAWTLLDHFVSGGGRLYVETGWQYLDPDWQTANYDVLPVQDLQWGGLDPQAPVVVDGRQDPRWGPMSYQGAGWGASSAGSVQEGAEPVVSVAGRVVVARWTHGSGRVVWSGMNLMAHAEANPASDEGQVLADQWSWLLAASTDPPQQSVNPRWVSNDEVTLPLTEATGPVSILFKEAAAPGWSAELQWPGGSKKVGIDAAEMDYMLVQLDSVPAGAQLVFRYGPTVRTMAWWTISLVTLGLLLLWLLRPELALAARRQGQRFGTMAGHRLRTRVRWDEE
jgi:hypothetical protein